MVAVVATVVAMVATQWLLCSCYIALTSGALQHCTHTPPQFVDCLPPPYTTLDQTWRCKSGSCSSVASCSGYKDISSGSESDLLDAVASVGPVRCVCACVQRMQ